MSALAARVEAAADALPEQERRVMALRERDGADYRAIAAQVGGSREGVADLLVSARMAVWSQLHGDPAPPRRTAQCGPARRVLAAQSDGEPVGVADTERAREHLAGCEPCTAARVALREAEIACRAWAAADAGALSPSPPGSPAGDAAHRKATRTGAGMAARRGLIAAAIGVVLLIAVLAAVLGGDDGPVTPGAPTPGPGSAQASGQDVVPPPGDKFCPTQQPDCK